MRPAARRRGRLARRVAIALFGVAAPAVVGATAAAAAPGGLGVHVATVDGAQGALVVGLVAGRPAARIGLRPGDRIVELGGAAVTSSTSLAAAVAHVADVSAVPLAWVDRAGGMHRACVSIAHRPAA